MCKAISTFPISTKPTLKEADSINNIQEIFIIMFIVIQIWADLLAALLSILVDIFNAEVIGTPNLSSNENNIPMIECSKVLMLEYPKILMIEYYKADDTDEMQPKDIVTEIKEIKEQTSNDCVASLTIEEDISLSEKNIAIGTNIIFNESTNTSKLLEPIVDHREELDEYERFVLQILHSLF